MDRGDSSPLVKREARAAVEVSDAERAQIIAAVARGLKSQRQVDITVFGSDGGKGYQKVKHVCDTLGLLMDSQFEQREA